MPLEEYEKVGEGKTLFSKFSVPESSVGYLDTSEERQIEIGFEWSLVLGFLLQWASVGGS